VNVYVELTKQFNSGELRAVLSSGQAVVLHRLAVMSKDGDWILRESEDALRHVLEVLSARSATYRFGAPLDVRWMEGGWSSHFQFHEQSMRVRTDFVTRPPRLSPQDLESMWREQENQPIPFLDARRLAQLKLTNREKDYAVIGELARLIESPREQLLLSRSARDIVRIAAEHPDLAREMAAERAVLEAIDAGIEELERALDAERRECMHANERRLQRYLEAASGWTQLWPEVTRRAEGLPLAEAHEMIVSRALGVLPFKPTEEVS
jgi:hypothetical protein